jgi:hypothetical protein
MPTNKSPQVQQAVIAKRLQGESKRKIARDLEMGRDTVDRILSESQVEAAVAQGRTQLVELVPKAIQLIQRAIDPRISNRRSPQKRARLFFRGLFS